MSSLTIQVVGLWSSHAVHVDVAESHSPRNPGHKYVVISVCFACGGGTAIAGS